ncbi:MAG: rod shape-determining protein MreD [Treponema sp.]|nr:rod shape-determining protein MreD [Treponema sp.]
MIKSISISAVILLCCALIESAILSNIAFLMAIPDLSLICVLYFSLHNGRVVGESTGFISGLFIDFLSAAPMGLNCLFRTVLGYLGGVFTKTFNTEGIIIPAVLGFCATIIKCFLILFVAFLFPSSVMPYNPFSAMFLFELCANTILTPVMFKILGIFRNLVVLNPENVI